jgi:hypothetical protein
MWDRWTDLEGVRVGSGFMCALVAWGRVNSPCSSNGTS